MALGLIQSVPHETECSTEQLKRHASRQYDQGLLVPTSKGGTHGSRMTYDQWLTKGNK